MTAQVTGGAGFGADIADSFTGANTSLLLVTVVVVALLLLITYRSPVLWLVPLAVVGARRPGRQRARRRAVAAHRPDHRGLDRRHRHRAGVRRRHRLRAAADLPLPRGVAPARGPPRGHAPGSARCRAGGRGQRDHRRAEPADSAAGQPRRHRRARRHRGRWASRVAALFALVALPAALVVCGRGLFWPFIPRVGEAAPSRSAGSGRGSAAAVARRPGLVTVVSLVVLGVLSSGLIGTRLGLSQTEQFRVEAESVDGLTTLSRYFPAGAADPDRRADHAGPGRAGAGRRRRHARVSPRPGSPSRPPIAYASTPCSTAAPDTPESYARSPRTA